MLAPPKLTLAKPTFEAYRGGRCVTPSITVCLSSRHFERVWIANVADDKYRGLVEVGADTV